MSANTPDRESGFEDGAQVEREVCAAAVEAVGCLCFHLWMGGSGPKLQGPAYQAIPRDSWWGGSDKRREPDVHDPRCPRSLAADLRSRP
jgi:hypothetical protein